MEKPPEEKIEGFAERESQLLDEFIRRRDKRIAWTVIDKVQALIDYPQRSLQAEHVIRDVRRAVQEAKEAGVDVTAIEEILPELERVAAQTYLEQCLQSLRRSLEEDNLDPGTSISHVERAIEAARKYGGEVASAEEELLKMKKEN